MRIGLIAVPVSFGITLLAACSGSTSSSGGVSADQAASDTATAYCTRANACAPAYVQLGYGDVPTCTARLKGTLLGTLASNGTSDTTSMFESCSTALATASCDGLLGHGLPTECQAKPGTLAAGTACGDDSQCVGGHCNVPSGQVCGACSTFAAIGGACAVNGDCNYGLVCANQICVTPGAAGAMCDAGHPCSVTLACKSGTCAMPDAAGAPCTSTNDTCDHLSGAQCNGVSMTCASIGFAMAGGQCGLVQDKLVGCEGGGKCVGATVPPYTGTCQAAAADGATCNAVTGPVCLAGATCVGSVCKVNDPSTCH